MTAWRDIRVAKISSTWITLTNLLHSESYQSQRKKYRLFRAIFSWVSKVIWDCIGFALLRSVIDLENSNQMQNENQSRLGHSRFPALEADFEFSLAACDIFLCSAWLLQLISLIFRASGRLLVLTMSSDWFLMIFSFVLIGRCDYFGFGLTTLNIEKRSIVQHTSRPYHYNTVKHCPVHVYCLNKWNTNLSLSEGSSLSLFVLVPQSFLSCSFLSLTIFKRNLKTHLFGQVFL